MNRLIISLFHFIFFSLLFSQNNQDARMLGLNGSYTTLAMGYQSIGINPGNIASYSERSINIFNLSHRINNNGFSISNYNAINGANLEDSTSFTYLPKAIFYDMFGGEGIRLKQNLFLPFPLLNFSTKRLAFTSNLTYNSDFGIPNGLVDFLILGTELERTISIYMDQTAVITQNLGLSYGHKYKNINFGITFKYILGLFYMGMETVQNPYINVDITGFDAKNQYLIKQAIGGGGLGLDIGISTKPSTNGIRFGVSIINLLGSVNWTQDHFMRSALENTLKSSAGDFYLRPNEFMYMKMVIDSLTGNSFSQKDGDPLIYFERYKVIAIESLSELDLSEEELGLVIELADGTYFVPSGGNYKLTDILGEGDQEFKLNDLYINEGGKNSFTTRQPMFLRAGLSKEWENQAIMAVDLVTGFSDSYGSSASWRGSIGLEILRFKGYILRSGFSLGGITEKSFSLGYGMKLGAFRIDFGLAVNGGFSLSTAKGFDLAFGIFL